MRAISVMLRLLLAGSRLQPASAMYAPPAIG
jgi:hypothetical protein